MQPHLSWKSFVSRNKLSKHNLVGLDLTDIVFLNMTDKNPQKIRTNFDVSKAFFVLRNEANYATCLACEARAILHGLTIFAFVGNWKYVNNKQQNVLIL